MNYYTEEGLTKLKYKDRLGEQKELYLNDSQTPKKYYACPKCGNDLSGMLMPNCYDPAIEVYEFCCMPCKTTYLFNYYFGKYSYSTVWEKGKKNGYRLQKNGIDIKS